MKTFITILVILGIGAGIIFGITSYLQPTSFAGCTTQPNGIDNCQKADAIIALSGGDTTARAEAAIELYKNGWADTLIFSGAAQDKTGPSNAAVMKKQAVAEGVPNSAILIDEQSVDTAQNATNTEAIIANHTIHTVILVTSGYHQRRANLEFQHTVKNVIILNAPTDDQDWNMWWWLRPRGWWLASGELVKIVVFYFSGATS